ncbi:hypothetical protein ACUNV4_10380 [Granulosicoccus sp. 3-233]
MQKKKRGRPPTANPATEKLPNVRVTPDQLQSYVAASKVRGESLSAWVKRNLDRVAKRDLNQ